jgi:hypothetical protein
VGAAVLTIVCVACGARQSQQKEAPLLSPAEARAVAVAERFVRENGYTEQAPEANRVSWDVMDLVALRDAGVPADTVLSWRRHTIKPRAYGVTNEGYNNTPGWTVYFLPARGIQGAPLESRPTGRAVAMSTAFSDVFMPHLNALLDCAEKVLVESEKRGRRAERRRTMQLTRPAHGETERGSCS